MSLLEKIKQDLEARLSPKRFKHTQSVVETAIKISAVLELEDKLTDKIVTAAWLHDCCKELKNSEQLKLAEFYGIDIDPVDQKFPNLLHARVGSKWIEEEYEIYDPMIIYAIRDHTLGAANMPIASKVVYLADMIEPLRGQASYLENIRRIIFEHKSLDQALLEAMNQKLNYTIQKNSLIHPQSIKVRNSLIDLLETDS